MRRRIYIVLWLVFWVTGVPALQAQSYRVYRPVAAVSAPTTVTYASGPISLELQGVSSYGTIQDAEGHRLSRVQYGGRVRAWWWVRETLAVGIAGQYLKAADMKTHALTPFTRREEDLLVRLTLTPDTLPTLYIIAGVGHVHQRSRLRRQTKDFSSRGLVWRAGIGGEVRLWKGWQLVGEGQVVYDTDKWDNFLFTAPRTRTELSLGMSYRF